MARQRALWFRRWRRHLLRRGLFAIELLGLYAGGHGVAIRAQLALLQRQLRQLRDRLAVRARGHRVPLGHGLDRQRNVPVRICPVR